MKRSTATAAIAGLVAIQAAGAEAAVVSRTIFSKYVTADCTLPGTFGNCVLSFGVVPSKHRYELRHIACEILSSPATIISVTTWQFLSWKATDTSVRYGNAYLFPQPMALAPNGHRYFYGTSEAPVVAPTTAKNDVLAQFVHDGNIATATMACTLSGVDLKLR